MSSMRTMWTFGLALLLIIGVGACQSLPEPPKLGDDEVLSQPDYLIAPRDTIGVFVWRSPELSTTVPVRPDGKVSLPLINELQAAGKTPLNLAKDIERALRPYVQVPKASVVVQEFANNDSRTVQVLGEVNDPKSVPYRPYITLLDLIVAAGGLTEFADGNSAKLIRRNAGEGAEIGKTYGVKLDDLIADGNLEKNTRLMPGDLVVVPASLL
ncbi:MAG: XrtA/PEP-CTERM system exopolysaccharide export protein [Pseudomonadota bacterium]